MSLEKKIFGLWCKSVNGQTLFFPYGVLRKGWVIPDPIQPVLARFVFRWLFVSCLVIAAFAILFVTAGVARALIFVIPAHLVMLLVYWASIRRVTSDLDAAPVRISMSEIASNQSRLYPGWLVRLLLIFAAIMVGASAVSLVQSLWHPGSNVLLSAASFVFFSFCLLQFLKIRDAQKKQQNEPSAP